MSAGVGHIGAARTLLVAFRTVENVNLNNLSVRRTPLIGCSATAIHTQQEKGERNADVT